MLNENDIFFNLYTNKSLGELVYLIKRCENEKQLIYLRKIFIEKLKLTDFKPNGDNYDLDNIILACNNLELFNKLFENPEELANIMIKINNPKYIYMVAKLPKMPLVALENAIVNTKDYHYITNFACDVKNTPIGKITNAIINCNNPLVIYEFALKVEATNKDKLADAIIQTNDYYYIYMFARDIKNAPINKLSDAIIKSKDYDVMLRFCKDIKGAHIDKMAQSIIETKDNKKIIKFASEVEDAPIDLLAKAVIKSNDANSIYEFASVIKNAPISELAKGIVACGDANNIYEFAKNILGAPTNLLVKALINKCRNQNREYLLLCAKNIFGAPIDELAFEAIKSKDINVIKEFASITSGDIKYTLLIAIKEIENKDTSYKIKDYDSLVEALKYGLARTIKNDFEEKNLVISILKEHLNDDDNILVLEVYLEYLQSDSQLSIEELTSLDKEYLKYHYQVNLNKIKSSN